MNLTTIPCHGTLATGLLRINLKSFIFTTTMLYALKWYAVSTDRDKGEPVAV